MTQKLALDLPVLLPDALDARDRCIERLSQTLDQARAIEQAHVVAPTDGEPAKLCLHYDPEQTSLARIRSLAEAAGATISSRYGHILWPVEGVSNARRARILAERLRTVDGVLEAEMSSTGVLRAELDLERAGEEAIRSVLDSLGVHVKADPAGAQDAHDHARGFLGERSELVFAVASGVLVLVGFLLATFSELPRAAAVVLYAAAFFCGGFHTAWEAIQSIRNRRFEIDFLMLVAAAGAAILGEIGEGALLLFLFSTGHALEGYAMGRARRAIEALAEIAPKTAVVRRDGVERQVPVAELAVGDVVVVKPNERLAADGFVVKGVSSVNQAPLTGESVPVDKQPVADRAGSTAAPERVPASSRVFAGTINGSGLLEVEVTRPAGETALAKVVQLVAEAETQGSPTQRFTDRFERVFVPVVLALVAVLLAVGPLLGEPFSRTFYRAMAVLVAASPCALAIATPSAVLSAVARAGRGGVLVKGGGPLELLGRARAIAFDKTGTLTEGRPRVTDVVPAEGVEAGELWSVAVAVEARSDHPLAAAVVRDAAPHVAGRTPLVVGAVTGLAGKGIRAEVDGRTAVVGNESLLAEADGGLPGPVAEAVRRLRDSGRTVMIVRWGERWLGVLGLMDTPRPTAGPTIEALRRLGLRRIIMLSGDHKTVADAVGSAVGVDEAWGDLMPEDKVRAIERIRAEEGLVAMVGDGVNDAPALAHASVGIAMGAAGSDVALETADIALMSDDLARLPFAVGLSRRASRIIRQNLFTSLGVVAILIPATIARLLGIGPAVLVHEGSTLIVVANALRLLRHRDS